MFKILVQISNYNIIPTKNFNSKIFNFTEPNKTVANNFQSIGYESFHAI